MHAVSLCQSIKLNSGPVNYCMNISSFRSVNVFYTTKTQSSVCWESNSGIETVKLSDHFIIKCYRFYSFSRAQKFGSPFVLPSFCGAVKSSLNRLSLSRQTTNLGNICREFMKCRIPITKKNCSIQHYVLISVVVVILLFLPRKKDARSQLDFHLGNMRTTYSPSVY